MEKPSTTSGPTAPPRYPGWATPVIALISLGFLIAAVGGPGPVLSLNVSPAALALATASAVVAVGVVLFLERWSYSRRRAQAIRKPKPASRNNAGWILGAVFLTVVVLRMLVTTNPLLAAVIFGVFGGAGLTASALFQWENGHTPPK